MRIEEIKELKSKSIEEKKKELPSHILEMGLNMLYKEPANLKEELSANYCEILEIKNFNQNKTYDIGKNTCALIISSDEVFLNGSLENLSFAKENYNLPIIAKDYFLEEYQIYLSRIYQADGVIVEPSLLNDEMLEKIAILSLAMGIEPIFNIHNLADLERFKKYDFAQMFIFEDKNLLKNLDQSKFNIFYDENNDKDKLAKGGIKIFIRVLT